MGENEDLLKKTDNMHLHKHILCLITEVWNKLPCPLSSVSHGLSMLSTAKLMSNLI